MSASNDERPDAISPTEYLESIALEALAAPKAVLARVPRNRGEIDVQAALGKHPNIAVTSESGATESSLPAGLESGADSQGIDDYCDSQRLDIPARLHLFAQVCQAVHFAHQHAIIHGALKPGNIVVTADGVPKLSGFGSSPATCPEAAQGDEDAGKVAGLNPAARAAECTVSLEYLSPEQLTGEPITTASDIYSLGVVLYQLLAGRSPYRLKPGTRSDVIAAIFEQAIEKPSDTVTHCRDEPPRSASGAQPTLAGAPLPQQFHESDPRSVAAPPARTAHSIARARSCSPERLKRILAGDLDAIVLTAMRKEPERRYASAEQLADDLHRYLEGMPVRAYGDSKVYRCRKFLKRHPLRATMALLAIVAVGVASLVLTKGLITALRQRDRTQESLTSARDIVDKLLTRISNDPLLNQPGFDALRVALLEDAQRFYRNYLDLHRSDDPLHPELIEAQSQLARIANLAGSTAEAEAQFRQVAASWELIIREQAANRHDQERLATTLGELGSVLMVRKNRLDEAGRILHRAAELIEPLIAAQPQSVSIRRNLGRVLLDLGQIRSRQKRTDEALELLERALEIDLQLATEDPRSLESRISLAAAYATTGQILAAEAGELQNAMAYYQQASETYETVVQEHPELANQAYQLACNFRELSQLQERTGLLDLAAQNLQRSLSILERLDQLYPEHSIYQKGLGSVYNMMTDLQRQRSETADSLALGNKARTLFERLVSKHPLDSDLRIELARTYDNIGRQLEQAGETGEALRSFRRAIDLYESLPELGSQTAYKLACNISHCIPLIGARNPSTGGGRIVVEPAKSDQLRQRFYGDRAIAALRRAIRSGRLTAETLETEKDLDPLHDRADFQQLIHELERQPDLGK